MAIKIDFNDSTTGLSVTDAYGRIEKIELFPQKRLSLLVVSFYNSEGDKGKLPIKEQAYKIYGANYDQYLDATELAKAGKSGIERAYVFLKTLPEFDGGVDV